jgi:hypothetical protein
MLRLKVVIGEVAADAIIRVLQLFHDRNIAPRKITAQRLLLHHRNDEVMHLEIELASADITIDALRFVAAHLAQMPTTLSTVFGQDAAEPGRVGAQTLVVPIAGAEATKSEGRSCEDISRRK